MKNKLLLVGSLLVVGAAAYGIYKAFCGTPKDDAKKALRNEALPSKEREGLSEEKRTIPAISSLDETKTAVINSIRDRHSEAAVSIEKALRIIYSTDDESVVESDDSVVFESDDERLAYLLK